MFLCSSTFVVCQEPDGDAGMDGLGQTARNTAEPATWQRPLIS